MPELLTFPLGYQRKGAGYYGLSAPIAPGSYPIKGVAAFTGIGGSVAVESVAGLGWNTQVIFYPAKTGVEVLVRATTDAGYPSWPKIVE